MTYKEVNEMIESMGLPYCYYEFTNDTTVAPPFISYYYTEDADLKADNKNYCKIRPMVIELYTDEKDFAIEETVENALNENGLVYSRDETRIDSERMYMVTFNTSVIITEESNE